MTKGNLSSELPNPNRRDFLIGTGSTVAAGVIATCAPANAAVRAADESTGVRAWSRSPCASTVRITNYDLIREQRCWIASEKRLRSLELGRAATMGSAARVRCT